MGDFWNFLKNELSFKTLFADLFTFGIYGALKIRDKILHPKLMLTDKDLESIQKSWWY